MKRWILALVLSLLAWQGAAQAERRAFTQPELDALLAPVALYPDSLLSHILVAATYPDDLREAAAWSRANTHLSGDDAVRAVDTMPWHPSVKALAAFPDLLARMGETPQWTRDLATAYLEQEPHVMDTVQELRRRAQASGTLQSNEHYSVQQYGPSLAVVPVQPQYVYLPYYDPYVVYGPWWHAYRPVYWRPWYPRPPVYVSHYFYSTKVDWHRRHVVRPHHRPQVHHHHKPMPRPIVSPLPPSQLHRSYGNHRVEQRPWVRQQLPQATSVRPVVREVNPPQVRRDQPQAKPWGGQPHQPGQAHRHHHWRRG